jgi:glutathione S-transferase
VLAGPFHIGYLALVCAIEWLALPDIHSNTEEGRPRLAAWYETVRDRPSLMATRPG